MSLEKSPLTFVRQTSNTFLFLKVCLIFYVDQSRHYSLLIGQLLTQGRKLSGLQVGHYKRQMMTVPIVSLSLEQRTRAHTPVCLENLRKVNVFAKRFVRCRSSGNVR